MKVLLTNLQQLTNIQRRIFNGNYDFRWCNSNEIQKFPFASDSNASDVGDLINSVYFPSGQQY